MIEAFILYFTLLLSVGVYFFYKNKSTTQFAVGDQKLNYWITAISAQASDMSDWLFMGFPGVIYATGLAGIWTACGLVFFMFLNWHFIAPRLRMATEFGHNSTLASFLQAKCKDQTNTIRVISGIFCLYFFVFYIAAGLAGLGRIFEYAFAINYFHGMYLGLAITLAYTLLGGFLAIAWSNLLQGLFLLVAIVIVPLYAVYQLGGPALFLTILHQQSACYLSIMPAQHGIMITAFQIMAWGLGYFGQPHILINFMNIDDVANMKKAKYVGISWQILVLAAAVCVGLVGKAFIHPALANQELVFISMVTTLFAPFFAGFILCAMLAATISTINTQALVSASLIADDLYFPFKKEQYSTAEKTQFTRAAIFVIPLLALIAACYNTDKIFDLVFYAWSGLGCCFGPLVIMSLYSRWVTPQGAIAGLVAGGLIGMLWPINHTIPALVIGFIVNVSATYCISFLTKKEFNHAPK